MSWLRVVGRTTRAALPPALTRLTSRARLTPAGDPTTNAMSFCRSRLGSVMQAQQRCANATVPTGSASEWCLAVSGWDPADQLAVRHTMRERRQVR